MHKDDISPGMALSAPFYPEIEDVHGQVLEHTFPARCPARAVLIHVFSVSSLGSIDSTLACAGMFADFTAIREESDFSLLFVIGYVPHLPDAGHPIGGVADQVTSWSPNK